MKLSSSSDKDNNNNKDYDSSKTDKELLDSYDGLLPRLFSLKSLLTSKGMQLFQKIQSTNKVVPNAAWIFTALTIYTYLQHPLLKKYDFDIFEFAEGARSSYTQIVKAISSTDFSNFCNGYSTRSEDNLFLRDVVHPRIYSAAKESCQLILNKNQKFKLIDIDVTHFMITSVQVEIVDEESKLNEMQKNNDELEERNKVLEEIIKVVKEKEGTTVTNVDSINNNNNNNNSNHSSSNNNNDAMINHNDNPSSSSSSSSLDSTLNSSTETEADIDTATAADIDLSKDPQDVDYPINSVLAHVQCSFRSIDTYEVIIDQSSPQVVKNVKFNTWTFTGCISGHIDLNWQLTKLE